MVWQCGFEYCDGCCDTGVADAGVGEVEVAEEAEGRVDVGFGPGWGVSVLFLFEDSSHEP